MWRGSQDHCDRNLIEKVKYEDAAQWTKADRPVYILTATKA